MTPIKTSSLRGKHAPHLLCMFFPFLIGICCLTMVSCHSSRSVSSYDCEFDTVRGQPVSRTQLPKQIIPDINAWGNTGWLFDEAQVVDEAGYEVYQVRLRNRSVRKTVCYQIPKKQKVE